MTATYLHLDFLVGNISHFSVCTLSLSLPFHMLAFFLAQPFDCKLQTSKHTPKSLSLELLHTHNPIITPSAFHIYQTGTTVLPNILPIVRFPRTFLHASWTPVEDIAVLEAVVSLKSIDLEHLPLFCLL